MARIYVRIRWCRKTRSTRGLHAARTALCCVACSSPERAVWFLCARGQRKQQGGVYRKSLCVHAGAREFWNVHPHPQHPPSAGSTYYRTFPSHSIQGQVTPTAFGLGFGLGFGSLAHVYIHTYKTGCTPKIRPSPPKAILYSDSSHPTGGVQQNFWAPNMRSANVSSETWNSFAHSEQHFLC